MVDSTNLPPLEKYILYDGQAAADFKNDIHAAVYKDSIENQEAYFDKLAQDVHWHKKYETILDKSD